MNDTNEKALSEFIATVVRSKKLAKGISKKLMNVMDNLNPEDIHYGHVGDLMDVETKLSEIYKNLE